MFKLAKIHYPQDKNVLRQIGRDIAALHCTAAVQYMDKVNLDDGQKAFVISHLASERSCGQKLSA